MKKKTMQALDAPKNKLNPHNAEQRLRRIRNELSLLLQQCDDALERVEKQPTEAA